MSDKWNNILIEWANCLKLARPIKTLQELGNGEFFTNLQNIITKNENTDKDALTFTFDLLNKHYPKYTIENDPQIHLVDLPLGDLSSITTLLLHYICIYDRKDILTSPMCQSLKRQTQIIIKNFLQLCTKNVTNDDLRKIIEQCCDNSEYNSPLQDLLRTPSRLHDKDREIAKLKAKLEVERDEKNDLLEELKIQQQNNDKLANSLKTKSLELSKLRNELENPNKSLTENAKNTENDTEKRLKCEIESLEQYISKLEIEINDLRVKREKLESLTEKLQDESIEWQKKYLENDLKFQQLEKQSKDQEITLNCLKQHCNELESLLEEFRTCKNDSNEDSFRVSQRRSLNVIQTNENLAESVVDVQLKELQKECDNLKLLLNEKIANENNLKTKIVDLQNEIKHLNDDYCKKIYAINELNQSLQKTYHDQEIIYEQKLQTLGNSLSLKDQQIVDLNNDLKLMKNDFMIKCDENVKHCEKITEICRLNEDLSDQVNNYKGMVEKLNFELNTLNNDHEIEKNKMENDYKLKKERLNNDLQKYIGECNDLKTKNQDLLSEISFYCEKNKEISELNQTQFEQINNLNKMVKTLEETAFEQKNRFETELKNTLISKEEEIKELINIKNDLEQNYKDLNSKNIDLNNVNTKYCEQIRNSVEINEKLQNEVNNLKKNLEFVETTSRKYEIEINELENDLKLKQEQIKQLNYDLKATMEKFNDVLLKNNDLLIEQKQFCTKIEEVNKLNGKLESNIEKLNEKLKNVNMELNKEKNQFESKLNELLNDLRMRNEEIEVCKGKENDLDKKCNDLDKIYNDLMVKNKDLINENQQYCVEIQETVEVNGKLLNEIEILKRDIEIKENAIKDLKTTNFDLINENSKYYDNIQESNKLIEKLENKMDILKKNNETSIKIKDNEIENLNRKLDEITSDFHIKGCDLESKNSDLQNANKMIAKLTNDIENIKKNTEIFMQLKEKENETLNHELEEIRNDFIKKNSYLESKNFDLINENINYKEHLQETVKFIEKLESDIEILRKKCDLSIKLKNDKIHSMNHDLKEVKSNFTRKFNDLESKNTDLFNKNKNYSEKIQENVKLINKLENEINILKKNHEISIQSKENEIQAINSELEKVKKDFVEKCSDLQSKNSNLICENTRYSEEMMKSVELNEELKKKLESLKEINETSMKSKENEIENLNCHLEKTVNDFTKKCNDLQLENSDLLNENFKFCKIIEEIKNMNENLNKINSDQEIELNNIKEENKKLSSDLKSEIEMKQQEIENLTTTNENLEIIKSDLLNKCEELTNSYEKQLKEFTNQILQLTTKNNELFNEHKENLNQMKDLQNDLLNMKQLNNKLNEDFNEKINEYVELNQQFDEFKIESQQQIDDLTKNIHTMVENYNKLKNDYDLLENKEQNNVECLRSELGACSQQISVDLTKIQYLTSENEQLELKVNFYKNELDKVKKERNEIIESQTKLMKETENNIVKIHEQSKIEKQTIENDLKKLREAYGNIMSENSKLELENLQIRKKLEEKSSEINDYQHVKEAYEKLLEENNKYMIEIDTIHHKRSKDREEYVRLLKKERDEADERENQIMKNIKLEYEEKLDKMKQKMLKMYRDELDKELKKVENGKQEKTHLQKIINDLRSELFEAEQKINVLETNLEMKQRQAIRQSKESIQSLQDHRLRSNNHFSMNNLGNYKEKRVVSTLPRSNANLNMYEETVTTTTSCRRRSVLSIPPQNIEMEDEEENCLFNEKYLTDLKDGRCKVQPINGRDSTTSRYSELAWRNSMVPAHLKSSYPAETQFISPSRFKEDDLKSGNIELDDSMCKLLPGEKPRQRKDFGTTSYKKPGPPTPSKNGGRLSLQGNEVHPLREHNAMETKKSTPSRLKDLFRRNNTTTSSRDGRENSENHSTTPKARRLSNIFRKPK